MWYYWLSRITLKGPRSLSEESKERLGSWERDDVIVVLAREAALLRCGERV